MPSWSPLFPAVEKQIYYKAVTKTYFINGLNIVEALILSPSSSAKMKKSLLIMRERSPNFPVSVFRFTEYKIYDFCYSNLVFYYK